MYIKFVNGKDLQRSVGHLQNLVVMEVSSAYLSLGWRRLPSNSGDHDPRLPATHRAGVEEWPTADPAVSVLTER